MEKRLLPLLLLFLGYQATAQIAFTDNSTLLVNESLTSGVAIGVCDMNNDGLDDIIRLDDASDLEIEFQQSDGSFSLYDYGNVGSGSEWALVIADIDENGYNDILIGGAYNNLKMLTANGTGSAYTSANLSTPNIFLQNANFSDINNDGSIDLFACHDDGVSSIYLNNGSGAMTYDLGVLNPTSTIPSDNSGNYGSIWVDYDNDGDQDLYISKCRLGVTDPLDGRRVNLLFQNDGANNFTDVAQAAGLRPLGQSWAANFEDIDNDGDLDCFLINHDIASQLFENNGDGTFTDITSASGMSTGITALGIGVQVIMEDFDNDGFVDVFLTGLSGAHVLFENDGDDTFTVVTNPIPTGGLGIQSAAVGDLNDDGFLDILAGYATGFNSPSSNVDKLFLNNGNFNNWSKIQLEGVQSNSNGIGARIELHGSWGTQIREVRSGESYGNMNSMITHYGIGSATAITKVVVKWPSGVVDELLNPTINQTVTIIEGQTLGRTDLSAMNVSAYPNPTSERLQLQLAAIALDAKVSIFSVEGIQLYSSRYRDVSEVIIPTSTLSNGLYFAQIEADGRRQIIKFLKE